MRAKVSMLLCVVACSPTATAPTVAPSEATTSVPDAPDAPDAPAAQAAQAWRHDEAFLEVHAALRDGDWARWQPFNGANITYERSYSISEDPPTTVTIAPADAESWLAEIAATWAPSCLDEPEPPCESFNQLSLGAPEGEPLQLVCDAGCCRHEPALLHNTPFLQELCFDDEHRVTRVVVIDG